MTIKINNIPQKQQKFYSKTELKAGHAYIDPDLPNLVYIARLPEKQDSGVKCYAHCLNGIHVISSLSNVDKYIEVNLEINVTEV
jgi:hypothetical protein